jgi:hypothetical protein
VAVREIAYQPAGRSSLQVMNAVPEGLDRNRPHIDRPTRRRLRTYAFDPMTTRLSGRCLDVDVPFEENLKPGPVGELLQVVDYDGTRGMWYRPVDLDDPMILAQGGLRPVESDPRAHQQIVYAVASSVIERLERFLGRRFRWRKGRALVLIPHAFEGRNAFFDPDRRAVLFGYYRAEERDPGPNLPGQLMFTCLSSDIIAHEVTHAIVHRLRPNFSVATNPDVYAWHEAFADLVALFHHFSFPEIVAEAVAQGRSDLQDARGLLDLAREFGVSTGRGEALRSAIQKEASPDQFRLAEEPHERGACFVAGVFDALVATYRREIDDLLRIATGGTGELPPGHLHPDLVARVTTEAVKIADRFLGMVVRAFDFLPTVDVTFGDVVRAIVTADRALFPEDERLLRATLVESLRRRGVYPTQITSLADEALRWPQPEPPLRLAGPGIDLSGVVHSAAQDLDTRGEAGDVENDYGSTGPEPNGQFGPETIAPGLLMWANDHAVELGLDPNGTTGLAGVHVTFHQAADRQPRPLIVLQFGQRRRDLEDESVPEDVRIPIRAGVTLISRLDGTIDSAVAKPLPLADPSVLAELPDDLRAIGTRYHELGVARLAAIRQWMAQREMDDPVAAWTSTPALRRLTFASLHSEPGGR